jgi:hypothetical protein
MPMFLALQGFVVFFIALHDWVPLGRLNDVAAVRAADPRAKRLAVTVVSALPFAVALAASLWYAPGRFPAWLMWLLWLSYLGATWGILKTWWLPYLFGPSAARAARYRAMFARTHAFLPARNGFRPDTLHVVLHAAVFALVFLLARMSLGV